MLRAIQGREWVLTSHAIEARVVQHADRVAMGAAEGAAVGAAEGETEGDIVRARLGGDRCVS
jgi:uncharacterized membrane protein